MRNLLLGIMIVLTSVASAKQTHADHKDASHYSHHPSAFPHLPPDPTVLGSGRLRQPIFSATYQHPQYPLSIHGYFGSTRSYGVGLTLENRYGSFRLTFGR